MLDKERESVLFRRCVEYYNTMLSQATDDHGDKVWLGFVSKSFASDVNRARAFITLSEMGCIRRLREGKRNTPAIYHLRKPPTVQLFEKVTIDEAPPTRAELYVMVRDLRNRVERLEASLQKGE
jgi:hypothetical protein